MLPYHHAAPSYSARPPSPRQQQIRPQQVGASMENWEEAAVPNQDDDEAPPPPYARIASLHRTTVAEEEEDREESERSHIRLRPTPNGHHLLAMTVNSSIMGSLHFQPSPFPCTGTFLAFQKHWKAVWFKVCRQKLLGPDALESFVWETRILFFFFFDEADAERRGRNASTTTMVLGEDTWPIFQQYMAQDSGYGVAGMRLQVDIDASRRARRVCRETVAADGNHNEAMLLVLGRHVPATTTDSSTTPAQAGSKRQQLKQLILECRRGVQRWNAEAKAATEARHAETRRRELVMVARWRELNASRLAVSG